MKFGWYHNPCPFRPLPALQNAKQSHDGPSRENSEHKCNKQMKLNYRDNKFALIIIIKINLLRNFSPPALSTSFLRFEGNVLLVHLATPGATVYAGYVAPRTRTATTISPPRSCLRSQRMECWQACADKIQFACQTRHGCLLLRPWKIMITALAGCFVFAQAGSHTWCEWSVGMR